MQDVIALMLVFAAASYLARTAWNAYRRTAGACGGCQGCAPKVVQIESSSASVSAKR